jgi:hypothetical protein
MVGDVYANGKVAATMDANVPAPALPIRCRKNSALLVVLLCSASWASQSLPPVELDVPSLLAKVRDHQDAIDHMKEKYTYTQTSTEVETDNSGRERKRETKTYDVSFYNHREIDRLTAVNGKPLSDADKAKEDRRLEKLIRDLEAGKNPPDPDANRRMSIATLLRAEHLRNPRRDVFGGRNVIVFDFEPDPAFRPASSYESFYRDMAGTMWVDEADLQVARVEFKLIGAFKVGAGAFFEMKPGAWFLSEQGRFFGEIWLPTRSEVKFDGRALLFYKFGADESTTYSDYRRFDVSTEEKVKAPGSSDKPDAPK